VPNFLVFEPFSRRKKASWLVNDSVSTSVFHRYAIVDNQDVARAMDMLERSQDQQRQELERTLAAKRSQPVVINDRNATGEGQMKRRANLEGNSPLTSRLRHVEGPEGSSRQIHRNTRKGNKALANNKLSGAGRGT
jgi:hypothetical protein